MDCLNELIAEIIYELTGARRHRKEVSSHIQVLRGWVRDMEPPSKRILEQIRSHLSEIQHSNILDEDDLSRMIDIVEDILPNELDKLSGALIEESQINELSPPRPRLDFGSSPVITPNAEIFRLLSSTASDPNSCYTFSLSTPALRRTSALADDNLLSPTLINRFHRKQSLAVLASNLVYEVEDDIRAIYAFDNQDTGFSIKRLRLTFVEGYMQVSFIERLASGLLNPLPNLRELFIELWPRNPTRENKEDRFWGHQTFSLLDALGEIEAHVVIDLRWMIDCERFERGYVGIKGWRRVEGQTECLVETNDMCRRSYERGGK